MGDGLRFSVIVQAIDPPAAFTELVETVERLGFDNFWVADSSLHARCTYTYLSYAAAHTSRIKLGTGITHPVTRHPAININSIVTLHEVSGGRAVLGIGAGDRPVLELGLRPAPVAAIEDMVHLARRLVAGETVSLEGHGFRTEQATLVARPQGPLPIYVAASGPKTLMMAGRVADGVLMQVGADPRCVVDATERVAEGAAAAGRSLDELDLAVVLYGAIGEDREEARKNSRAFAAWVPQTVPRYCRLVGIPDEDVERVRQSYSGGELMKARGAAAAVTEEMIDAFTLSGTPEECRAKVEKIVASSPVRHIAYFPIGSNRLASVTHFAGALL